jgi:hypothetical protein
VSPSRPEHREALRGPTDWEPYLRHHSGLPGPRANLELLQAAVDEGDEPRFRALAASNDEFVCMCGVAGLAAAGEDVRAFAVDPRWRVREAVVLGLQRRDWETLAAEMERWAEGSAYEQRAAVATLCEPPLLRVPDRAERVLRLLEDVTERYDRRDDPGDVLRKALGYGWSVAVAAAPEAGLPRFERLRASADPDVRWIVRENLRKARLARLVAG